MGAPDLKPLTAQLVMTPEMAADLQRESRALELARQYVIDSPDMARAANDELRDIKRRLKVVDDWHEKFLAPLKQLRETTESFFGPARKALKEAEQHLKAALLEFQRKEDERIAAERREREEAERRARQEAERVAAAERARAEAKAAEERRKAEEAERARLKAVAEGNARAAAAAAAEAAKAQERAAQAIENGEAKAAHAQLEAAAVAQAAAPVQQQTALAGFGTRENWVAEFAPGQDEDSVKVAIVTAIATARRADLLAVLALDMKAVQRIAKAQKKHFNVPGMVAKDKPIAASRG